MYVCICKEVTDSQLRQSVEAGVQSVREVSRCTGLGSQCGKCVCFARERIDHHRDSLQARNHQAA